MAGLEWAQWEWRWFSGGLAWSGCRSLAFVQVPQLFVEVIVRNRCCARVSAGVSSGWRGCVEPGHQFAVGGAGGGEVLVAFFELQPGVNDLLFERYDALLKRVDVSGSAESCCAPGSIAE